MRATPAGPVTSGAPSRTDPRHAVLRKAATVIALCVLGAFAIAQSNVQRRVRFFESRSG